MSIFHALQIQVLILLALIKQIKADELQINQCQSGSFYLPQKGDCEPCFEGCSSCTTNQQKDCIDCQIGGSFICSRCQISQFFNEIDQQCSQCANDCLMCTNQIECLKCKEGYIYSSLTKSCDTKLCDVGYYRKSSDKTCIKCPYSIYSQKCFEKILIQGVVIQIRPTLCLDGLISIGSKCDCPMMTYMDKSTSPPKCFSCTIKNCQICNNKDQCTFCKKGFYLFNNQCAEKWDDIYITYFPQQPPFEQFFPLKQQNQILVNYANNIYCKYWYSYVEGIGCFKDCLPYQFRLFRSATNSFECVKTCPQHYTLNLQSLSCIQNDCQNDISQIISGQCYHYTCPIDYFFEAYKDENTKSICKLIDIPQCLNQQDQSTSCNECQIGYLKQNCKQSCSEYEYILNDYCNNCPNNNCTSECQYKLQNSQITYSQCVKQCPRGYYLQNLECLRFNQLTQLELTVENNPVFQCEWGQDSSTSSCEDLYNLSKDEYLDEKGTKKQSQNACNSFNTASNYCEICDAQNNFNLKGICTKGFLRTTRYNVLPNKLYNPDQFIVVEICPLGYFIQLRYIQNQWYRVCKKFAVSSIFDLTKQQYTSCENGFYLLNGNCIDECPKYTYQNNQLQLCEDKIENCSQYSQQVQPLCEFCYFGYVTNFDKTECILASECKVGKGYVLSSSSHQCQKCQQNCEVCDGVGCQKAITGYFLYQDQIVQKCLDGYYADSITTFCLKCQDLCIQCIDDKTCTKEYQHKEVKLFPPTPYINDALFCESGKFFNYMNQQCQSCSTFCKECYQIEDQCLVCSDPTQVLYKYKCLQECPSGQYSIDYSISPSISQKLCNYCNSICEECKDTSTFCTKCKKGLNFFKNSCLLNCPETHFSKDGLCYLKCKVGQFNKSVEECSQCSEGCIDCQDENTCQKCSSNLVLQDQQCIQKCSEFYKINPSQPNNCLPCLQFNCNYCQINNKQICEQCENGYQLKLKGYCQKIKDNSGKDNSFDDLDDKDIESVEENITYNGKIYEGKQCHFTCKKCKGDKLDECLSCKLANRVFFNNKYCMCPDNTHETGEDNCQEDDQSSVLQILDLASSWLVLLTLGLNRLPVFSILMIDILSLGSYQIYFDQLYNYLQKYSVLEVANQANFSSLIPNYLKDGYMKDIGVFRKKTMLSLEVDQDMDEVLRFSNLTSVFLVNALPYLIVLGVGLAICIVLRVIKPLYLNQILNQFWIFYYYLTFQDQILFMGIQFKFLSISSEGISIASLITLFINILFNGIMIFKLYQQFIFRNTKMREQSLNQLITLQTIFMGLLLKLLNALNILLTPTNFKSYVFVGLICIKLISEVYNIFRLPARNNYRMFYKALRYIIAFQLILFCTPALLNQGYQTNQILDDKFLHNLQVIVFKVLIFQKIIISLAECLFIIVKNNIYNNLLRNNNVKTAETLNQISNMNFDFNDFTLQDLEVILSKNTPSFLKKKK